jgi:alkylhydroperoxidase family enzyme
MASNDLAGISFAQPRNLLERTGLADKCCAALEISMPLLVDGMDDRVGHIYSGMPDRLYIIDRAGRVAYQGGRGPFGFKAGEMEQELVLLLLDEAAAQEKGARVPLLSDKAAWKRLPRLEQGTEQSLPSWARALADALPRTTASMLELDRLHRSGRFLAPRLRGLMRWEAARANRCLWSEAQAFADLRRGGVPETILAGLTGDRKELTAVEREAMAFARKLTSEAHRVTDEEVERLVRTHGEKATVAMVLLLAHANFQDRLILSLGLAPDDGAVAPPLDVRFARDGKVPPVPGRKVAAAGAAESAERVADPGWLKFDFGELQKRMEVQRERKPRIRVPTWEEVSKALPPGSQPARPLRILWSLVCGGYQPELAAGWSACTRAFGQEARQDRVFEECLFWVVTRELQCFY